MLNEDVISMPDKWEYPWYAAWDLAFHALPLSIADPDFAKSQMKLMLRGSYLHPAGNARLYSMERTIKKQSGFDLMLVLVVLVLGGTYVVVNCARAE